jgi:hypothetical protein
MPRIVAAILMAVLALNAAPARSSEAATANDTARFLAGLPPSSNSPLAAYTKDPVWQQHARYFDSIFAREESAQLSKVREFSNKFLADKHDTMLYMFSGPDFLYATSFFPNASTYVLAGLEPVGEIADLTALSPWAINGELRNLELSMDSLFNFSFFITQNMKTQLREGPVNGTLPILYIFLARTGKTIHELNLVSLDEHGNFQIAAELAAANSTNKPVTRPPHSAAAGVKIVFTDGAGPKQTLYYFSTNLADGSFERSGFSAFLAKFGPVDSFIKSASYLLHKGHFAGVRKLLLNGSATILQDDSGIPLAYFEARKWRFQSFGHYAGPISIFANFYQPQMAELFKSARPIEFGIGYRWRKNESNLLLAQKESSPINDAELTPPSQAEGNAAGTAAPSPKKMRKRVETEATRSAGCRIARVFPFCW